MRQHEYGMKYFYPVVNMTDFAFGYQMFRNKKQFPYKKHGIGMNIWHTTLKYKHLSKRHSFLL